MALIDCPECRRTVSDKAQACPNCGFPVAELAVIECPECSRSVPSDADSCPHCGYPIAESEDISCSECEREVPKDTEVCPHCGFPIKEAEVLAAAGVPGDARTEHAGAATTPAHAVASSSPTVTLQTSAPAPDAYRATSVEGDRPAAIVEPASVSSDRGGTRPAKPRRSPLITVWLWLLPIMALVPASLPYVAGVEDIDLPLMGTVYSQSETALALGVWGLGLWISLSVYYTPMLIAFGRRTLNRGGVTVVNIFLGWTVIGWVVAYAMSLSSDREQLPDPSAGPRY